MRADKCLLAKTIGVGLFWTLIWTGYSAALMLPLAWQVVCQIAIWIAIERCWALTKDLSQQWSDRASSPTARVIGSPLTHRLRSWRRLRTNSIARPITRPTSRPISKPQVTALVSANRLGKVSEAEFKTAVQTVTQATNPMRWV